MSPRCPTLLARPSLAVLAVLVASLPAGADGRCYGEWSDAAPIVAREQLRSARDIQALVRSRYAGDVVRIVLCEGEGGFVYRVVLRQEDGRIVKKTVDAMVRVGEREGAQPLAATATRP